MSILKLTSKLALPALLALSANAFSQQLNGYKIFGYKGSNAENEVTTYGDYVFGYSYPTSTNFTNPDDPNAPGEKLWFNQGVAKLRGAEIGDAGSASNNYRSEGAALGIKNNTALSPNLSDCDAISYYYKGAKHSFQVEFDPTLCGMTAANADGSNKWGLAEVMGGPVDEWTQVTINKGEIGLFNTWGASGCGNEPYATVSVDFSKATQIAWEVNNKLVANQTQNLMIADVICIQSNGATVSHSIPPESITVANFPAPEVPTTDAETFAAEIKAELDGSSIDQIEIFADKAAEAAGGSDWENGFADIIILDIKALENYATLAIGEPVVENIVCEAPIAATSAAGTGTAGNCTAKITVEDGEGETAYTTITVTINPAGFDYWGCSIDQILVGGECKDKNNYSVPEITSESLKEGKVGVAYKDTLKATSVLPVTWTATGLPAGLSYNASTGIISGTPTAATAAPVTVTIKATNDVGFVEDEFEITIAKGNGATLASPVLNAKTQTGITINAIVASTGQTVLYAISTTTTAPEAGGDWQTGLTFSGLTAGTTYYVFAYAQENANYLAGAVTAPTAITTNTQSTEKGPGATLTVSPSLNSKTANSITINAITAPANGQVVEYAIGTTQAAPATGWQTGLTFSGLTAGTTYYVFARAQENESYLAGTATVSAPIVTDADNTPILSAELAVINSQIPEYYNLKGAPLGIQKPSVPGIYIVKMGSIFKKIAVK